ncbi:MAG: TetR/AcrR family transcriptional regulator [Leptospirales bacterium]|nr:TetR/AcrR family transcriptional regulator [Leptospirales bacterium]
MSRTSGPATRSALIQAGLRLLEKGGLAKLSVDEIARRAGVAKGTFYVHFSDRTSYLLGIHRDFHEQLKSRILQEISALLPGRERLLRGATVYLDACLEGRAVKALLFEARSSPELRAEVERRNASFTQLAATDFSAINSLNLDAAGGEACARLFVAMCAETALAELNAGRPLPELRAALELLTPLAPALRPSQSTGGRVRNQR